MQLSGRRSAARGKHYATKQIEAYALEKPDYWLVITIITKYF
jgi:hypothetical protein